MIGTVTDFKDYLVEQHKIVTPEASVIETPPISIKQYLKKSKSTQEIKRESTIREKLVGRLNL